MNQRSRIVVSFVVLFVLYQSAEGVGARLLHSFPIQAGLMTACVLAAWPLSHWLGFRGYGAWALGRARRGWSWLAGGLLLAIAAKAAAAWLGLRSGILVPSPAGSAMPSPVLLAALPMMLLSTFVPSLAEDILTRGFWYRAAGIAWRRGAAFVGFSATMYVLNHVYRIGNGPLEWLSLASMGIACATALWRTGSLWAAVGLHWGWNLANGLVDALVPMDIALPAHAPLLSIAANLALTVVVLALGRGRDLPEPRAPNA
ncbi:CPBP family intramembrane metalloprotease [Luteimonas sp. 50]|uniref:CPBP family intramembrane metalloprotease n=1 Tax=Cognatiluteimonas sedimenti TaxID=2927791 RepID=A0ABT0A0P7_9GAMM|nr:CPBP family intramembrane glutamic endopeptidase [Lysobacter sedimenti]MCJ0824553.1 CPBP family intramembrane metalloprotease [Lysobacter sedimenti]